MLMAIVAPGGQVSTVCTGTDIVVEAKWFQQGWECLRPKREGGTGSCQRILRSEPRGPVGIERINGRGLRELGECTDMAEPIQEALSVTTQHVLVCNRHVSGCDWSASSRQTAHTNPVLPGD